MNVVIFLLVVAGVVGVLLLPRLLGKRRAEGEKPAEATPSDEPRKYTDAGLNIGWDLSPDQLDAEKAKEE